jgi:hypothetical protein
VGVSALINNVHYGLRVLTQPTAAFNGAVEFVYCYSVSHMMNLSSYGEYQSIVNVTGICVYTLLPTISAARFGHHSPEIRLLLLQLRSLHTHLSARTRNTHNITT